MHRPLLAALALLPAPAGAQPLDPAPRVAVMSAYAPEWTLLTEALEGSEEHVVHGTRFLTGTLEGRDVVLFLSGISMVNAAMTTQMALDRFEVEAILFSGIAGGVDPALAIGDVVIAERWGQYMDAALARETADGFALPSWMTSEFPPYGMIHTRAVDVQSARAPEPESRFWFEVDPALLDLARGAVAGLTLEDCAPEAGCLSEPPGIEVGGNGVSGSVFVDNAGFREWAFDAFDARVLDMESAAVAHVAYVGEVPFLAVRSLSDLAGGGEGENEIGTFLGLAAGNSATVVRAILAAMD